MKENLVLYVPRATYLVTQYYEVYLSVLNYYHNIICCNIFIKIDSIQRYRLKYYPKYFKIYFLSRILKSLRTLNHYTNTTFCHIHSLKMWEGKMRMASAITSSDLLTSRGFWMYMKICRQQKTYTQQNNDDTQSNGIWVETEFQFTPF